MSLINRRSKLPISLFKKKSDTPEDIIVMIITAEFKYIEELGLLLLVPVPDSLVYCVWSWVAASFSNLS